MKIAVVLGSIRDSRFGIQVAQWAVDNIEGAELVDLKEFNLPLLTSAVPPMMLKGKYDVPEQQAWGEKMAEFDAFIFVTGEYNHSIPGALKNAIDSLGVELLGKKASFVSYGFDGAIRAVDHLRIVLHNFSMSLPRAQVSINLNHEMVDGKFVPAAHQAGALQQVVEQLTK
ncbi:FMN-dependent NADPH-azoreductase [Corynebacterium kalinowskii]|uniref:FMN-dependent NADPH-azoreductase n=1 Tax=Corynebacterium kalinowskii TaxID=2675216 RepID=A0A6B8VHH7_9CORY|nr:NAD(P)H-dependent oxidoreductase [Corynebacterium kalinowskii]QGU01054.1 FMN-dependent NADPH-azoreductase [Corynebacterium kalinowskii]